MLWSIKLKPVKTRYPLTSIMWPYRGLRFELIKVTCFLKLTADQVLVFRLDRGLMSGQLVVYRAGLYGTWLMLTQDYKSKPKYIFFSYTRFSLLFMRILRTLRVFKLKTEGLTVKLQNSNQNSRLSRVSLIGLWTIRPRSSAFRPGLRSIYYLQVYICNTHRWVQ